MTRIVVLQQIGHIFEHRHTPLVKFYGIPLTNMTEEVGIIEVNDGMFTANHLMPRGPDLGSSIVM